MAAKPIEFHEEAAAEFVAALEWYIDRSEFVAERFAAEFSVAVEAISRAPQRWPSDTLGIRRISLDRFPFSICYRETLFSIQVIAVAHARRKPGYWKSRL